MQRTKKIRFLAYAAITSALYVVLTFLSSAFGLASGVIQIRLSEALTVLPAFTPAAIPGVFIGCLLSNLLTGCLPWDVVFGSLASLIGSLGTYFLRKKGKWTAPIPPILSNAIIVPLVLQKVYGVPDSYPFLVLTVGIGEIIAAGILGMVVHRIVARTNLFK
ncbi:MAG: QueT transporter family protein [Clostridia bacterium]|nr:QueT transporter family protein [Clostridia bacterium]